MSEKKIEKVTEQLDEIKKMSKDEINNFITKQNKINVSTGISFRIFGLAAILSLILSVPLFVMANPVAWGLVGLAVITEAVQWVCYANNKKGKKIVEDCLSELDLRIKEETEHEFEMAKIQMHSLIKGSTKRVAKEKNKTTNKNSSKYPAKKKKQKDKTKNAIAEDIHSL